MSDSRGTTLDPKTLSDEARAELKAMGLLGAGGDSGAKIDGLEPVADRPLVSKRPISAPEVLVGDSG